MKLVFFSLLPKRKYEYDNYGNIISETAIEGDKKNTVKTEYHEDHQFSFPTRQLISVKDADGKVSEVSVSSTYDKTLGTVTLFTDARQKRRLTVMIRLVEL